MSSEDVLSPVEELSSSAAPPRDESGESERSSDLELMRAVAQHDPLAEAALVRRVITLVRCRARGLTRNRADADDATQNSLIEILCSATGYRGEGSLEGWCERIAVRTTLRAQRRQAKLSLVEDLVDPDAIAEPTVPARLAEALPGGEVSTYLAELSDERHRALLLRHVQGYSVDEIAALTEVSPNTVKDRLRVARKLLRQSIRQRELIATTRRRS